MSGRSVTRAFLSPETINKLIVTPPDQHVITVKTWYGTWENMKKNRCRDGHRNEQGSCPYRTIIPKSLCRELN